MLAQARQIHHEGVFKFAVNVCLHLVEVIVGLALVELAAQYLFPVRPPFDFLHAFAGNQGAGAGDGAYLDIGRVVQVRIVKGKGFVIVINFREAGVAEDFGQHAPFAAGGQFDLAVGLARPSSLPAFLVLPVLRVANAGLGFHIVEPGILHAFA
jgi:hypothetical protein